MRLVPVEVGLGDPDGQLEIVVRQLGIDDLVTMLRRYVGLTPPGTDCQPCRKRIFIAGAELPSPDCASACRVAKMTLLISTPK
jgi:hypothetical protein